MPCQVNFNEFAGEMFEAEARGLQEMAARAHAIFRVPAVLLRGTFHVRFHIFLLYLYFKIYPHSLCF